MFSENSKLKSKLEKLKAGKNKGVERKKRNENRYWQGIKNQHGKVKHTKNGKKVLLVSAMIIMTMMMTMTN